MNKKDCIYRLYDIRQAYGGRDVLDIPEICIEKGKSIGLSGPNGSGKSTMLRIMAFLETPLSGEVYFNEKKVNGDEPALRNQVTLLLQEPFLLKRTVFDNVAYGLKIRGISENLKDRVNHALRSVGLYPEEFAHRRWYELSGGEAQRVCLASRLVLRPKVLMLDEPTASVDRRSAVMMKEAIASIRQSYETTLFIASHDLIWLNQVTDIVFRMYEGRIVGSGTENVISGPWHPDKDGLWARELGDGQKIIVTQPEKDTSVAILDPTSIIISLEKPAEISAQNILQGKILQMNMSSDPEKVELHIQVARFSFTCIITRFAAEELNALPGLDIWVIFKATSVSWQ
ncbi:MAG: ATP-binding cassette domain-containing protein [Deltaproteobacteria bacterium]|nr:ATP-binding cassette domain-containing protein [Deltaproteobacteria bacterium]